MCVKMYYLIQNMWLKKQSRLNQLISMVELLSSKFYINTCT